MKIKSILLFLLLTTSFSIYSQQLIYMDSFEALPVVKVLNDTGITWAGDYPTGSNVNCASNILSDQDCHQGRDNDFNNDNDGHAGFDFTKLDSNGTPLAASATSWSCVKDNVTGMVWEVKTTDGSIHDQSLRYKWGGVTHKGSGYGTYYSDWDTLVNGSNSANFCGFNDWRVPSVTEMFTITDLSVINPPMDTNYFPNSSGVLGYWTNSAHSNFPLYAWYITINGSQYYATRNSSSVTVQLVRSD